MNNQPEQPATRPIRATKSKPVEDMTYFELQRWMRQFMWRERYDSAAGRWRKYKLRPDYVVGEEYVKPVTRPGGATKQKPVEDMTYYELQRWMSQFMWRERYDRAAGRWRKYKLGPDHVVIPKWWE